MVQNDAPRTGPGHRGPNGISQARAGAEKNTRQRSEASHRALREQTTLQKHAAAGRRAGSHRATGSARRGDELFARGSAAAASRTATSARIPLDVHDLQRLNRIALTIGCVVPYQPAEQAVEQPTVLACSLAVLASPLIRQPSAEPKMWQNFADSVVLTPQEARQHFKICFQKHTKTQERKQTI